MGWIITALLSILVVLLTFKIVKINKENKELKEDRTNAFETFLRYKTDYIEQKEKERRDTLRQAYDQEIAMARQRAEIEKSNCALEVSDCIKETELVKKNYEVEQSRLQAEKQKVEQAVADGKRIAAAEVDAFKQKEMARINNEVQSAAAAMASSMDEMRLALEKYSAEIAGKKTAALEEYNETLAILEEYRQKRAAVNEAILREKEIQEKEDFYRILLTENDLEDMRVLESIAPRMKHRDLIPKLIWDAILRRPVQEMEKRILNGRDISGIYKVTYIKTGESYIGKTTDIKTRWINHAKTAIGLEAAASSTFHTRLAADGIENYTWEVLEEVPKDKLSEREKYWIEFYETNKNGLNMRGGG